MNIIGIIGNLTQSCTRRGIRFMMPRVSFKSFTSSDLAREIMDWNFFGVEEAVKHFGVNPSTRELACLARIPFSEKTLTECKYTHILIAVFPLSILEIGDRVDRGIFDWLCFKRLNEQAFLKDCGTIGWHLVRKTPAPNFTKRWWCKRFRDVNNGIPSARVLIYAMIGHHHSTRDYLYDGYPSAGTKLCTGYSAIKCSDRLADGCGVFVTDLGHWDNKSPYRKSGIGFASGGYPIFDPDFTLGVASERIR
jgi:hypothetical protein